MRVLTQLGYKEHAFILDFSFQKHFPVCITDIVPLLHKVNNQLAQTASEPGYIHTCLKWSHRGNTHDSPAPV